MRSRVLPIALVVVILVGIAPVKPAEFVIFRIGQGVAGTQVETETA